MTVPQQQGFTQLELVDRNTPAWLSDTSDTTTPTIFQLFIRGNPLRGIHATVDQAKAILHQLVTTQQLSALVLYGSPYVFEMLTPLLSDGIPAVFSYGQIQTAQAVVLEKLFSPVAPKAPTKEGMF